MLFRHPCFISYARGNQDLIRGFLTQLTKALSSSLEPYLFEEGPYVDQELQPGERFDQKLADAICRSVCMIVIYYPKYGAHQYCLREFEAMRTLEKDRIPLLGATGNGRGLIIPILLRGKLEDLPEEIRNHIHCCDFSKFTTATGDISRDPEYVARIERIASYIDELRKDFAALNQNICDDCHTFRLPDLDSITPWQPDGPKPPPFPG
jgi:TIR domain